MILWIWLIEGLHAIQLYSFPFSSALPNELKEEKNEELTADGAEDSANQLSFSFNQINIHQFHFFNNWRIGLMVDWWKEKWKSWFGEELPFNPIKLISLIWLVIELEWLFFSLVKAAATPFLFKKWWGVLRNAKKRRAHAAPPKRLRELKEYN